MRKAILATMMALGAMHAPNEKATQISSHKIETKREKQQLSKQQLQKIKGKKKRKNRGRNRK